MAASMNCIQPTCRRGGFITAGHGAPLGSSRLGLSRRVSCHFSEATAQTQCRGTASRRTANPSRQATPTQFGMLPPVPSRQVVGGFNRKPATLRDRRRTDGESGGGPLPGLLTIRGAVAHIARYPKPLPRGFGWADGRQDGDVSVPLWARRRLRSGLSGRASRIRRTMSRLSPPSWTPLFGAHAFPGLSGAGGSNRPHRVDPGETRGGDGAAPASSRRQGGACLPQGRVSGAAETVSAGQRRLHRQKKEIGLVWQAWDFCSWELCCS